MHNGWKYCFVSQNIYYCFFSPKYTANLSARSASLVFVFTYVMYVHPSRSNATQNWSIIIFNHGFIFVMLEVYIIVEACLFVFPLVPYHAYWFWLLHNNLRRASKNWGQSCQKFNVARLRFNFNRSYQCNSFMGWYSSCKCHVNAFLSFHWYLICFDKMRKLGAISKNEMLQNCTSFWNSARCFVSVDFGIKSTIRMTDRTQKMTYNLLTIRSNFANFLFFDIAPNLVTLVYTTHAPVKQS